MTAISAPRSLSRTTAFERTLLHAASALDAFVATRLARRAGAPYRRSLDAQTSFTLARDDARARGAIGILPR
jgi:hypothetical protein